MKSKNISKKYENIANPWSVKNIYIYIYIYIWKSIKTNKNKIISQIMKMNKNQLKCTTINKTLCKSIQIYNKLWKSLMEIIKTNENTWKLLKSMTIYKNYWKTIKINYI